MSLTSEQVRHLGISLMNRETERDRQQQIGVSDLSNGCDRCLANRLLGREIINPRADSLWLGARIGTSIHGRVEGEVNDVLAGPTLPADFLALRNGRAEAHLPVAHIDGYGPATGTIDLSLEEDVIDTKSSTRKKSALLQDYLAEVRGEPQRRWQKQKDTARGPGGYKLSLGSGIVASLSYNDYRAAMDSMVHKVNGYYGQTSLYGLGRERAGMPVKNCHILWINRDGNGIFDVPGGQRYDDPTATHDVWVMSFAYDRDYALSLVARGQSIWDRLAAGAGPADFAAAEHCFPCSIEAQEERRGLDIEATIGGVAA